MEKTTSIFFMNEMFYGCNSLVSFPDLTRWNSEEVKVIYNIFYQCFNSMNIPLISDKK